jgi:dihydroneopterin aldolase
MKLELNAIEVVCVIGDLPEEREKPQPLCVDISLEIPDDAAESDDLADTVDYAALAGAVRAALVAAKCRMIERAAKVAADVCMADSRVLSADVKVVKAGAVEGLGSAAAVISMRRKGTVQ